MVVFLSTLSLRRATLRPTHGEAGNVYFYPRSPCGERPPCQSPSLRGVHISIHALLAESDVWPVKTCIMSKPFLSTLSLRRATSASRSHNGPQANFYPRSPCGERRVSQWTATWNLSFLSTLSLRRATVGVAQGADTGHISIHALLAESDRFAISAHCFDSGISIHALLAESD